MLRLAMLAIMLLDRAAGGGPDFEYETEKISLPSTKCELRLMTLEIKLRSLNPWGRTGKIAKRIAEELLEELRTGSPATGAYFN